MVWRGSGEHRRAAQRMVVPVFGHDCAPRALSHSLRFRGGPCQRLSQTARHYPPATSATAHLILGLEGFLSQAKFRSHVLHQLARPAGAASTSASGGTKADADARRAAPPRTLPTPAAVIARPFGARALRCMPAWIPTGGVARAAALFCGAHRPTDRRAEQSRRTAGIPVLRCGAVVPSLVIAGACHGSAHVRVRQG